MSSVRPRSRRATKLAVAAVAAVLALVAGELVVRVARPQELSFNHSIWDPDVGFINRPGVKARTRTAEFDMRVAINSRGLRDREFAFEKPPHALRIGVFGDSYTFGHGVAAEETYPKVLERLANGARQGPDAPAVEVLNFGIGKTGTSHQLAWYGKEGRRYELDLVILGFLAVNDFANNWEGVYYLEGDRLVHTTVAYNSIRRLQAAVDRLPFYGLLANHSHLFNLAKRAAARLDDRLRGAKASRLNAAATEDPADREEAVYRLTLRLVKEFRRRAEAEGAGFLFLGLPSRPRRAGSGEGAGGPAAAKLARYERLLSDLAADGIEVLDLVPVFAGLPVEPHYFVHDGHMRGRGHEVVAEELFARLHPALSPGAAALSPGSGA